jgi:hypothetical protein
MHFPKKMVPFYPYPGYLKEMSMTSLLKSFLSQVKQETQEVQQAVFFLHTKVDELFHKHAIHQA